MASASLRTPLALDVTSLSRPAGPTARTRRAARRPTASCCLSKAFVGRFEMCFGRHICRSHDTKTRSTIYTTARRWSHSSCGSIVKVTCGPTFRLWLRSFRGFDFPCRLVASSLHPAGYPMRSFVRCYRISWFIGNGWYSPALKNRMRDLNKWPPPEKYTTLGPKYD